MSTAKIMRGVIVELDYTAIDGASILFGLAKKQLAEDGIDLNIKLEALHLVGGNYQGAFAELFKKLDKDLDAAAHARKLHEAFIEALTAELRKGLSSEFKTFVKTLADKGVKVVVATRADQEVAKEALAGLDENLVVPYCETAMTYGNGKWDAWHRAMHASELYDVFTVGVTGSGAGVKAVLVAGMSALAVINPHVAYQDFGGADAVSEKFDAKLAKEALRMLHIG